jgi:hypothetical protein
MLSAISSTRFCSTLKMFGAAFAGSWAIANLLGLGTIGARLLDALFVLCGIVVMVVFMRSAHRNKNADPLFSGALLL